MPNENPIGFMVRGETFCDECSVDLIADMPTNGGRKLLKSEEWNRPIQCDKCGKTIPVALDFTGKIYILRTIVEFLRDPTYISGRLAKEWWDLYGEDIADTIGNVLNGRSYWWNHCLRDLSSFSDEFWGNVLDPKETSRPTNIVDALRSMPDDEWNEMAEEVFGVSGDDLGIEDVIEKIRETNICEGLHNPLVFIDEDGTYAVRVHSP